MDKAEKAGTVARVSQWLKFIPGGALLFAVVPLIVLGYLGWFYYGAEHLDQALYSLQKENLKVTPQPPWIRTNVRDDIFANGRLDRVSLLEPRATAAIAQAFETHSWVKATTRVTKKAGGEVVVDLVYRRPIAMVYYERSSTDSRGTAGEVDKGFFPIDENGVVLPTSDFTSEDVWSYFLIIAEGARPAGEVGMPYGDVRITEALALCTYLDKHRQTLRLQEIWVEQDPASRSEHPWSMTLVTSDKREIIWGHAPKSGSAGEVPAEEKLDRMIAWLQQPADSSQPQSLVLDLRSPSRSPVATSSSQDR